MAGERKLTVVLAGDSRGLERAMGRASAATSGLGSKFAAFGKTAAIGIGALGAGAAVLGKGFVDAAVESQKVTAQTSAVIKSMGGAANVTAKQVADLSESLAMKSGVDDEVIQSGQNVLLTFGNVQNAIGDGPKIFDRATQAALDMSVALGTDMSNASMQVGKALNDPIRGLTALRRSGIQFTAQQEDQIKAMVAAGDTAGAQTVMLAELERQFGGSAAAQATAGDRLQVVWGNLQETLGEKLLPVVERVASWLADNLPGAMDRAGRAVESLRPHFEQVVAFVRANWPQIQATIAGVIAHIQTVIQGFVAIATALWANFGDNILSFVQRVWPAIQQVIGGALNVIKGIVETVLGVITGDWSRAWYGIKAIVSGAWNAIQGTVKAALEAVGLILGAGLEVIASAFRSAWNSLWRGVKTAAREAANWVIRQVDRMLGPLDEVIGRLDGIVSGAFGGNVGEKLKARIEGRAAGGPVLARTPYLVGEAGPELFVPRGNGAIVPNGQIGGDTYNINVYGERGDVVEPMMRELKRYRALAG